MLKNILIEKTALISNQLSLSLILSTIGLVLAVVVTATVSLEHFKSFGIGLFILFLFSFMFLFLSQIHFGRYFNLLHSVETTKKKSMSRIWRKSRIGLAITAIGLVITMIGMEADEIWTGTGLFLFLVGTIIILSVELIIKRPFVQIVAEQHQKSEIDDSEFISNELEVMKEIIKGQIVGRILCSVLLALIVVIHLFIGASVLSACGLPIILGLVTHAISYPRNKKYLGLITIESEQNDF